MRERTFRTPTFKEVLDINNIEHSGKINEKEILSLIDEGHLSIVGNSYKSAVESVENLEEGKIAFFPLGARIKKTRSDEGIKSLEKLVKVDSRKILREIGGENAPSRMTNDFLEDNKIWPYILLVNSMKNQKVEIPPWGFYWMGADGHFRGTTWTRTVAGAEMKIMKDRGDFDGKILDKTPYAKSLRVRVSSRDEEGKSYETHLFNLPMHFKGDPKQYSDWINIEHNSNDLDSCYRGGAHGQRKFPGVFWSASTIFAFYEAMDFVTKIEKSKKFKINPFPIPRREVDIKYIDDLRLRSLIVQKNPDGKLHFNVLNKTEIDSMIGARTVLRKYENCWTHWGKKDLSFLYTPKD
mgnify:FL=1